jgi:hypothetical protein
MGVGMRLVRRYWGVSRAAAVVGVLLVGLAAGCASASEQRGTTTTAAVSAPAAPPLTRESLPAIALGLGDLPSGFSVGQEGYVETGGSVVAAYRRMFEPGSTRLGGSLVAELSSDVALFQSPDAAARGLEGILDALSGDEVKERYGEIIQAMANVEPADLVGETLASPTLGDGTVLAHATFETSAGSTESFLLTVRVAQLHGVVFVLGPRGGLAIEDLTPLVEILVSRLETAVSGELRA